MKTEWQLAFEAGFAAGKKAKLEEIQEALGLYDLIAQQISHLEDHD